MADIEFSKIQPIGDGVWMVSVEVSQDEEVGGLQCSHVIRVNVRIAVPNDATAELIMDTARTKTLEVLQSGAVLLAARPTRAILGELYAENAPGHLEAQIEAALGPAVF